jgi:hypothetical protein
MLTSNDAAPRGTGGAGFWGRTRRLPFHDVCHSVGRRNASADGDPELLPLARYYFQDARVSPNRALYSFYESRGGFHRIREASDRPYVGRLGVKRRGFQAQGAPDLTVTCRASGSPEPPTCERQRGLLPVFPPAARTSADVAVQCLPPTEPNLTLSDKTTTTSCHQKRSPISLPTEHLNA